MARNYTRSRGRGTTANRRRLFWARQTGLFTMTSTNLAQPVNLLYDFEQRYGADLFGFTVTRIVGHYTYYTAGNAGVSTTYNYTVGIRVDDQSQWPEGQADSVDSQRLPVNDPFTDWMYVRNNLGIVGGVGDSAEVQQAADNRIELDLRAQRRLDEVGQSLYLIHGLNNHPGEDVYAWYDMNVLCKRP